MGGIPLDEIGATGRGLAAAGKAAEGLCEVKLAGANIAITREAEQALHERGVLSVPDFIANAGGAICASAEYHGAGQASAFAVIREKILANTKDVLERAKRNASRRARRPKRWRASGWSGR